MADKKISQLTAASTPLAGTEVLPIVQSSTTVKVATDDLTVKNVRSNATTGILQIAGPAAASTRTMTVPDANFTAARTDAGQTFTGAQNIVNGVGTNQRLAYLKQENDYGYSFNIDSQTTGKLFFKAVDNGVESDYLTFDRATKNLTLDAGNLVVGTAAKGIDFSANTGLPGETSSLLDWYEEGTWTPTAANITGTNTYTGYYTRIGNRVYFEIIINTSSTIGITGASSTLSLPHTSAQDNTCAAANRSTGAGFGTGLVTGSSAFPPTCSPGASQSVVVSGSYQV